MPVNAFDGTFLHPAEGADFFQSRGLLAGFTDARFPEPVR
ncbi:hypothetical protein MBT84_48850 [Streptomyces sp. MBT84]|nr:hypothetical protein [Streptomyces sp. MBT84]